MLEINKEKKSMERKKNRKANTSLKGNYEIRKKCMKDGIVEEEKRARTTFFLFFRVEEYIMGKKAKRRVLKKEERRRKMKNVLQFSFLQRCHIIYMYELINVLPFRLR